MTALVLCVVLGLAAAFAARRAGGLAADGPGLWLAPAPGDPAAFARLLQPPPAPPAPPAVPAAISDARLRQIAIGVRSRVNPVNPALSHITGVTAAEVTEMVVALARQRGIELRDA